jgi:DNA-directed RNA polymerase sigma subunit (sigma70/sigma32)
MELEERFRSQTKRILDRIRSTVALMGTAAKWHTGKASDLLRNPQLLEQSRFIGVEVDDTDRYLAQLPALAAETEECDRRCAALWTQRNLAAFLSERAALIALFLQFKFNWKLYERLVRQKEKSLLRNVRALIEQGRESTSDARAIEDMVRMRLGEFVAAEEELSSDLAELDSAREELSSAHGWLALEIAASESETDPALVQSAIIGLRKAATYYGYEYTFSFAEYAQHWIREAIAKRWAERSRSRGS